MPAPADAPIPAPIPKQPKKTHPLLGKTIARCVVGDRIGRGATSSVFRARYKPLDKDVALKILGADRAGDAEARARFLDEAKAVAKVDHENIVKVFDVVEDQGNLCILMELVDGESIQDLLDDDGPLPPKRALKVALDVARALEAAHEEEIVHRDIKPANFILDRKSDLVKVVDFGLAAKGANNRVGTPLYMSPEAAQGKRIDEKSDVYGLGVSLYQMLTGKHPFTGSTVKDILAAHVNDEAVPPSKAKPDIGNKYDVLLAKLLVKAKGYRPSSADVVALLEPLVDEPRGPQKSGGGRKGGARRSGAGAKKSPLPLVLGAVGALVVIAVVVILLNRDGKPAPAETPTTPPIVQTPPVVDRSVLARNAYGEADEWAGSHKDDFLGQVQRWTQVEKDFGDTDWGKKAAGKKADAAKNHERKKENEAQQAKDAEAKAAREAELRKTHELIPKLIAAYEFEAAGAKVKNFGAPEGTSQREWGRKATRLEHLGKEFLPKLDGLLKTSPIRASKVKPSAAPDEQIVGADRGGLVTDASGKAGKIAWTELQPEVFLKEVVKKSISAKSAQDQLFIAILATELSRPELTDAQRTTLAKEAKEGRQMVDLMDQMGDVKDRLKEFFVLDE